MFFPYGSRETEYLSSRDKALGAVIAQVGHVYREVDPDLFSAVAHHIIGQQISTKAQATLWRRLGELLGQVTPQAVAGAGVAALQGVGISFRKAAYIHDFSQKVLRGEFDLAAVAALPDQEAIRALCALRGVGVWTAEMILLFCLQRPDVLSFDDLAIQRGMRMVYRHRQITRQRFETYRRRYSPWGSVASLYLWAVAGGAVPGLKDPAAR